MRSRSFNPRKYKSTSKSGSSTKSSKTKTYPCYRIDPETGEVVGRINPSRQSVSSAGASASEIEAARSSTGGWTRETLASWGVSWPPRRGWKNKLIATHARSQKMAEAVSVSSSGWKEPSDSQNAGGFLVRMTLNPDTAALSIGSDVAHIWDGTDTACRMWSTSGMSRVTQNRRFIVYDENPGLRICQMCQSNTAKPDHDRQVIWGDSWQD